MPAEFIIKFPKDTILYSENESGELKEFDLADDETEFYFDIASQNPKAGSLVLSHEDGSSAGLRRIHKLLWPDQINVLNEIFKGVGSRRLLTTRQILEIQGVMEKLFEGSLVTESLWR